jgi:16S rRNA (guanine966-N2)-methyltransferase
MPRVIAGTAGGRPLKAPAGPHTRPTTDRVKEALFSSLGDVAGLHVLDLYAGSGSLGIEALSRGAAAAVLVETDRRAVAAIHENLRRAGVADRATVVAADVATYCANPDMTARGQRSGQAPVRPFDLVLADPPYRVQTATIERDLAALVDSGALAGGALVVLERDRRSPEPPPGVLVHDRDRTYGDTLLRYLRHLPAPSQGASPP